MIKLYMDLDLIGGCRITDLLNGYRPLLLENGIDLSDSHESYDYQIVSQRCFHFYNDDYETAQANRIAILESLGDNIIIFDDEDSPTMHCYRELLSNKKIKLVLKNYLLLRDEYRKPSVFGGIIWFQDKQHPRYQGYDFTDEEWNKIKLSGIDLGNYKQQLGIGTNKYNPSEDSLVKKHIDVFAVFKGNNSGRQINGFDAGKYYTKHRTTVWKALADHKSINVVMGMLDINTSNVLMFQSKVCISPFGMGEFCYRDFESIQHLTTLVKPDVSHVQTLNNFFIDGETYFKCKHDFSDLIDIIDNILSDDNKRMEVSINAYNQYQELYSPKKVVNHIKNLLNE